MTDSDKHQSGVGTQSAARFTFNTPNAKPRFSFSRNADETPSVSTEAKHTPITENVKPSFTFTARGGSQLTPVPTTRSTPAENFPVKPSDPVPQPRDANAPALTKSLFSTNTSPQFFIRSSARTAAAEPSVQVRVDEASTLQLTAPSTTAKTAAFCFRRSEVQSTLETEEPPPSTEGHEEATARPDDPDAWKRWLEVVVPEPPTPFEVILNSPIMRSAVIFFDRIEAAGTPPPPPLAPMVLQLVHSGSDQEDRTVGSPTDCLALETPNWWRRVTFSSVDVARNMPRLRHVTIRDVTATAWFAPRAPCSLAPLLSSQGTLRSLRLENPASDFNLINHFTNIRELHVGDVSSNHLAIVATLSSLATLTVSWCMNLDDVRSLAHCRSLTSLNLISLTLKHPPTGLECIPTLQALTLDSLSNDDGSEFQLGFFGRAPALLSLTLSNVTLQRDGLRGLEESRTLQCLSLTENGNLCDISYLTVPALIALSIRTRQRISIPAAQAASALRSAPSLKKLELSAEDWRGFNVQDLAAVRGVVDLDLGILGSSFRGSFQLLKRLTPLPTVETLSLEFVDDSEQKLHGGLEGVEHFPRITQLTLTTWHPDDEDELETLSRLPLLASLSINNSSLQRSPALKQLTGIITLSLEQCYSFTDHGVRDIAQMPALTDLKLSCMPLVTDVRPVLTAPSMLRRLKLEGLENLGDNGFGVPSPSLVSLCVVQCLNLSEYTCQRLVAAAATLLRLKLTANAACFYEFGPRLQASMPLTKVTVSRGY